MNRSDFMDKLIPRGVLAGVLIATADFIYINASNRTVAAFLFPLALISIMKSGAYLYTGKIGSVGMSLVGVADMAAILMGNAVGLTVLFLVPYSESYNAFMSVKLGAGLWEAFVKGLFCGILMYLAVYYTDGGGSYLLTIMCVAAFLVGGCEHSVADLGYMFLSRSFTWEALKFFLCVLAGNTIGSLGIRFLASAAGNF